MSEKKIVQDAATDLQQQESAERSGKTAIQAQEKKIILWKDVKFLIGFVFVVSSIVIGLYGKGLIVIHIAEPFPLIKALSVYALSWLIFLIGAFLVGMETIKMIQQKIHYHVKKSVKDTYGYTKELPRKGLDYTKKLHEKSLGKLKRKFKPEQKI